MAQQNCDNAFPEFMDAAVVSESGSLSGNSPLSPDQPFLWDEIPMNETAFAPVNFSIERTNYSASEVCLSGLMRKALTDA
jgi:hypothetical protein